MNIELDEKDWDERRNINKRKKLILEGKDPDEVKNQAEKRRKKELKREKKARQKAAALLAGNAINSESPKKAAQQNK